MSMLKQLSAADVMVNIASGLFVGVLVLVLRRLFSSLADEVLQIAGSLLALALLLSMHALRRRLASTREPVLLPLLSALALITVFWAALGAGPAPAPAPAAEATAPPPDVCAAHRPADAAAYAIYPDADPSGYMGDIGDLKDPVHSPEGVRFEYAVRGSGPHEWTWKYKDGALNEEPAKFAGIAYLYPPGNWGQQGGIDLRGFRRAISWEARSLAGEAQVEFLIGGASLTWDDATRTRVAPRCPDSLSRKHLGIRTLTPEWQSFRVELGDLPEEEFRNVVVLFAWIVTWSSNGIEPDATGAAPPGAPALMLEIRNIRYER